MTPTKNHVSQIPMQQLSYFYNVPLHRVDTISEKLTYEEYRERCEAIFNEKDNDTNNYQEIRQFQDLLLADYGYNALLGYKNAFFAIGVNYKQLYIKSKGNYGIHQDQNQNFLQLMKLQ